MQAIAHQDFAFEDIVQQPEDELRKLAQQLSLLEKVGFAIPSLMLIFTRATWCVSAGLTEHALAVQHDSGSSRSSQQVASLYSSFISFLLTTTLMLS